jgi:multicomponent Na+:H+ antiporter subunit A
MALIVTGVSAVMLLIAILLLYAEYGTFSLPELADRARPGTLLTGTGVLVAIAGLAKSAQVPLHFWLPRAMAAPTPVSAYLHSAAMVAAGVFLLARFYPLLTLSDLVLNLVLAAGLASIAVGGVLALTRDRLKQVLACSTISQYGYIATMYGLGGGKSVVAAGFYVVSHALAKSALFLTSGAVTEATGEDRLSRLGGLARAMPALAIGSGLAAAGLAALPLTIGFFKDELFFAAAVDDGWPAAVASVAAAALTFAYIGRFWLRIFLGRRSVDSVRTPFLLTAPVVVLALALFLGGIFVHPFADLAAAAARASVDLLPRVAPAYHLDARAENLMALAAYGLGVLLLAAPALWARPAAWVAAAGVRLGPERLYTLGLANLNRISDAIHEIEVRDLRSRIAAVLVPGGVLAIVGLAATPVAGAYRPGMLSVDDLALMVTLAVVALAAIGTTVPRRHLTALLSVAGVGFSLAVVYALMGGPDVALVAVLIETVVTLVFLGVLALVPPQVLSRMAAIPTPRRKRWRDPLIGAFAGLIAFFVVWGGLSRPSPEATVADEHLRLAPDAHARDVVTAILADFRGLDTLGEITVVTVALVGISTLLARGRLR